MSIVIRRLALSIVLLAHAGPAAAQSRTWVSGAGNDANPCSRSAPCITLAAALSKTIEGGEISVLDSGGLGTATITKSITIDGGEAYGSILSAGLNGVVVNAGADDRVTLRRLAIQGVSDSGTPGLRGIRFLNGAMLHVEDCVIQNFSQDGIYSESAGDLRVSNTTIRNVDGTGIWLEATSGTPRLTVENSRISEAAVGVLLSGAAIGVVDDTKVSFAVAGIAADGGAELFVKDATVSHSEVALDVDGGATMSTEGLTAVANLNAFTAEGGGLIVPFTGNLVTGNPPGGTSTCDVDGADAAVACFAPEVTCPAPVCPEPVCPTPSCPAPVASLGDCKRCKQKGTTMVCKGCGIDLQ